MVRPRTELQTCLENLLGSENVYFQPPSNVHMSYPCIVYKREKFASRFANNKAYLRRTRYSLTFITKKADSEMLEKLADINYCSHTRSYIVDNLYHDVYDLYW